MNHLETLRAIHAALPADVALARRLAHEAIDQATAICDYCGRSFDDPSGITGACDGCRQAHNIEGHHQRDMFALSRRTEVQR
jgi:hypothetical protein